MCDLLLPTHSHSLSHHRNLIYSLSSPTGDRIKGTSWSIEGKTTLLIFLSQFFRHMGFGHKMVVKEMEARGSGNCLSWNRKTADSKACSFLWCLKSREEAMKTAWDARNPSKDISFIRNIADYLLFSHDSTHTVKYKQNKEKLKDKKARMVPWNQ